MKQILYLLNDVYILLHNTVWPVNRGDRRGYKISCSFLKCRNHCGSWSEIPVNHNLRG